MGNSIQQLHNAFLKEKDLQEKVGISIWMLFIRSVKFLVKHFLRQLSNQTDARVVVSDTFLDVR